MALFSEKYRNSILYNILGIIVVALLFYVLFFASLGTITSHGDEVKMPVLLNKNINDAIKELEKQGFDVEVDSAYDLKKKSMTVLAQMPDTGSMVKTGRTIFLIVNKAQAPLTPMPDLLGVSYRSAEMILRSNKLILGDTTYRPDIANGAILEQMFDGRVIAPGDMVPQGSKIDLVIGDGLSNVFIDVPDVVGMTYQEGIAILNASGLQFIDLWEGRITDSATAIIYYQSPEAMNEMGSKNRIKEGDMVDIKIQQNGTAVPPPSTNLKTGQVNNKPNAQPTNTSANKPSTNRQPDRGNNQPQKTVNKGNSIENDF